MESRLRKGELDRMAAMLSRLGGRGYQVGEEPAIYGGPEDDFDPDSDFDLVGDDGLSPQAPTTEVVCRSDDATPVWRATGRSCRLT